MNDANATPTESECAAALRAAAETFGEGSPEFLAAYKALKAARAARADQNQVRTYHAVVVSGP